MTPANKRARPMSGTEWAMLIALATLWGGSFFFNELAVREVPVFTVVFLRVAGAAAILLAVLRIRGEPMPRSVSIWMAFVVMGAMNNALPFSLIVWGQQHIASGVASILNAATPLFTVLFAHVLTRDERLTAGKALGVVAGFVGIAVMFGPVARGVLGTSMAAQALCLGAAVSYALAGLFGRRFRTMGVTPLATAAGQVTASSVMLLPLIALVDRPWTLDMPGAAAWGAILGLALLSTALAYVLYFRILATAGATNLLLVTFLVPASAILLGTLALGETLLPRHLAGMGLIGLGLAAIDGRPFRAIRLRRY